MKIFKRFLLLGIILVLLTPIFSLSKNERNMDLIVDIFENMDASLVESNITLGGVIFDRFIEEEDLLEFGDYIKEEIGINGNLSNEQIDECEELGHDYYTQQLIKDKWLNQLIIQGVDTKGNLVTINISSYEVNGYPGETSLFINLINNEQIVENNDIILKVENIFDNYDKMVNITSCIVGKVNGKLDMEEKEKNIMQDTEKLKAKVVETYREDNILSLSMFTPLIDEYIYTGNKKMNLNIAVRYNELENSTYVFIGTPIITIGY